MDSIAGCISYMVSSGDPDCGHNHNGADPVRARRMTDPPVICDEHDLVQAFDSMRPGDKFCVKCREYYYLHPSGKVELYWDWLRCGPNG